MNAKQAGAFMRAFGDGTRLRLLNALFRRPMSVAELTRLLACPKPRVSRHLRFLHARGVVEWERAGNAVIYRLAPSQHRLHGKTLAAVHESLGGIEEVQRDDERLARMANRQRRRRDRGR